MYTANIDKPDGISGLGIIDSLLEYRKVFFNCLLSQVHERDHNVEAMLASDASLVIAQFFYRIREAGVESVEDIREIALRHNLELSRLTGSEAEARHVRLKPERIQRAIFNGDVMQRLIQNWRDQKGAIDQSNLARFLVLEMSTETCRKAVVALSQAGCLDRVPTPYGTTLVISNGRLESIVDRSISVLRRQLHGRAPEARSAADRGPFQGMTEHCRTTERVLDGEMPFPVVLEPQSGQIGSR
ncbi:hypothetical protein J5J86_03570 [Aquabacter sp. L1I39]|uniref:hypothetical protein n=1 Tax=Aquabacter sp. L1I39 TaxID=2820278 RepID=UPI001ADD418A|nr:hypothetical protein [Aquabacter sp. L1I39]QTL04434.1 hypothetical protein J5J86_03570 [Aquabacter sp. L1I39]